MASKLKKEHLPRSAPEFQRPGSSVSINGWGILNSPDWSDRRLKTKHIPGTGGRREITAHAAVLPLFLNLAAQYNKFSKLVTAEGYDARLARASTAFSDHYSGTAIDLNATKEGAQGMRNYSWWSRSDRQSFVGEMLDMYPVIMWGGSVDFGGSYQNDSETDWMHWALKPDTTLSEVQSLISYLGITSSGYRTGVVYGV